jgi:dimethylhistidine N-methyltransferase
MARPGDDRLHVERVESDRIATSFAGDVRAGLLGSPKSIAPKYFYDALGSQLFEAICRLPEYYLTRAEEEILEASADEVVTSFEAPWRLVELGSGSSVKTRRLIEAALRQQGSLDYLPIDISPEALVDSARSLLQRYSNLEVRALVADYEGALARLAGEREASGGSDVRTVVAFLGSSIGNLDVPSATELLTRVRSGLDRGDAMLLGADLRKDESVLLAAYDDSLGVTAAFNLNLLARINRELGGEFDLRHFRHQVRFNHEESRIEMYLVSGTRHQVEIRDLGIVAEFEEGESIHTENSYKYSDVMLDQIARRAGFEIHRSWLDSKRRFTLNLLRPS